MPNEIERRGDLKDIEQAHKRMSFIEYMADKNSRLLRVAYLITNNIDIKDPLRMKIRELSFVLRDMGHVLKDTPQAYDARTVQVLSRAARDLDECVGLLAAAGYLSEANASFLSLEYKTVERMCDDLLGVELFALPERVFSADTKAEPQASAQRGVSRPRAGAPHRPSAPRAPVVDLSDRRAQILMRVLPGGEYSIRHIIEGVPGVSPKTIQRELLAMVSEGILAKKGERRWSTYSRVS